MAKALYRKYRSKSLDEIIGQSHVTDVLRRAIEQDRVGHAYLLTGPRGVGKTSIARIMAHAINELEYTEESSHVDIIEIDAASNNGVEDIRDLRDKVQIAPVKAKKKVYIIDEVHMLSKAAFNALLKTLEEPPEHIVFILATTDVDKLPETIISRAQRFGFHAISHEDIVSHLKTIAKSEKIKISDDALQLIAEHGDGSFRDSISLLDQLSSLADSKEGVTSELVEQSLGLAPRTLIDQLLRGHSSGDLKTVVETLEAARGRGVQPKILARQLMQHIQKILIDSPDLILLLDELILIESSPQPSIKLLTTLAPKPKHPKVKPAPLLASAPSPVIEKPIPALEKKATQEHPKDPPVKRKEATEPAPAKPEKPPEQVRKKASPPAVSMKDFSWEAFVEKTRTDHVALYSVLSKCGHEIDGSTLVLYTGNNFYKKKLDDTKYRPLLIQILESIGLVDVSIDTIPTTSPLKDEQAAKVAAIMGGGEEVIVESNGK